MKLNPPTRVQIRVHELGNDKTYKAIKGRAKSITVYETTLEEVWKIIDDALEMKSEDSNHGNQS